MQSTGGGYLMKLSDDGDGNASFECTKDICKFMIHECRRLVVSQCPC